MWRIFSFSSFITLWGILTQICLFLDVTVKKIIKNYSILLKCTTDMCNLYSVQLLSHVQLFVSPWTAAHQASLSITNSWSLLKLMSIESMMPSTHVILCHPLLLPPSIFPSIRVFSSESVLCIRCPKERSFNFSISPSIIAKFRLKLKKVGKNH